MFVNWTDEAREELATIVRYIARRNPDAAERLAAVIEGAAERIPLHPYIYRPGRVPDTRETVVHPNYIIVYRVTEEAIETPFDPSHTPAISLTLPHRGRPAKGSPFLFLR